MRAMRQWRAEREAAKLRGGELGSFSKELSWGMRWRDEGVWWAVGAAAGRDSPGEDSSAEEEREGVCSEGG